MIRFILDKFDKTKAPTGRLETTEAVEPTLQETYEKALNKTYKDELTREILRQFKNIIYTEEEIKQTKEAQKVWDDLKRDDRSPKAKQRIMEHFPKAVAVNSYRRYSDTYEFHAYVTAEKLAEALAEEAING